MKKYAVIGFFLAFLIAFTLSPQSIQAQEGKEIGEKPIKIEQFVKIPTEKYCNGGICKIKIGSDETYLINYLKIDLEIDVKVINIIGNKTIEFEVNNKKLIEIPFETKTIKEFEIIDKEENIGIGENIIIYNVIESEKTIFDYEYKFGKNSTIITLNPENKGLLEDAEILSGIANYNRGIYQYKEASTQGGQIFYNKWNLGLLPIENITIINALSCGRPHGIDYQYIRVHHVYNQSWLEGNCDLCECSNASDCGFGITWNRQPCDYPLNSSKCNETYESELYAPNTSQYFCTEITNMVIKDYLLGNQNCSEMYVGLPTQAGIRFYSKEGSFKPYLNITYILEDYDSPIITLNSPINNSWQINKEIIFNATGLDVGSGIKNASLWHNCNGIWHLNKTNTHSNETEIDSIFKVNISDTSSCEWNVYFCDSYYNGSNCGWGASNFTVKLDTTSPVVTFIDPTPNGDLIEPFSNIIINVSITDPNNDTIILNWNEANETITQCSGKINDTFTCWIQKNNLQIGTYYFQVFANDTGNYWGSTGIRNVTSSWNYTFNVQIDLDITENLMITNKTCLNENILQIIWEEQHTLGGFTDQYQQIQNQYCDWGCDFINKRCRFDPLTTMFYFLIFMGYMLLIIVVPLITITRRTRKKLLKLILDVTTLLIIAIIYFSTSTFLLLPVTTFLGINYTIFIVAMILVLIIFYLIQIGLFMRNGIKKRYL